MAIISMAPDVIDALQEFQAFSLYRQHDAKRPTFNRNKGQRTNIYDNMYNFEILLRQKEIDFIENNSI